MKYVKNILKQRQKTRYPMNSGNNIYYIDYSDMSLQTLYNNTTTFYCAKAVETDNGILFIRYSSSSVSPHIYVNKSTLGVTQIEYSLRGTTSATTTNNYYDGVGYLLYGGVVSSNALYFNEQELTLTAKLATSSLLSTNTQGLEVDNGLIIADRDTSNNRNSGILFYDKTTKQLTQKFQVGSYWLDYAIEHNGYIYLSSGLVGDNESNGIVRYDPSDNSFNLVYSRGNGYKTLLSDGNIVRDRLNYNSLGYGANINTLEMNGLISGDAIGNYIYSQYGIQKISTGKIYTFKDDYSNTYNDLKEYGFEIGETMFLYKKRG